MIQDFDIWFYYNNDLMKTNKKQAIYNTYLRYQQELEALKAMLDANNVRHCDKIVELQEQLKEAVELIKSFDLSFQDKDWRNEFLAKIKKDE